MPISFGASDRKPDQDTGRLFILCFAIPLTAALLVLSAMTLPMRLMQLSGDAARHDLLTYQPLKRSDIDTIESSRRAALDWRENAESLNDLAAVDRIRIQRTGIDHDKAKPLIQSAIDWQERALARAPFDPFGWAQLAFFDLIREPASTQQAIAALRLSIAVAPYEPGLMVSRLETMMQLWDSLPPDLQAQFPDVVRKTWQADHHAVAIIAERNHFIGQTGQPLSDDPDTRHQFEILLSR